MNKDKIIAKQDELIEHLKQKAIYLDGGDGWRWKFYRLESELSSLKAEAEKEVSECDHVKTHTVDIKCLVCSDCGCIIETDV